MSSSEMSKQQQQRSHLNCDCNEPNCRLDGSCIRERQRSDSGPRLRPNQNCFHCSRPFGHQKWITRGKRFLHLDCDRPAYELLGQPGISESDVLERLKKEKKPEPTAIQRKPCAGCGTSDNPDDSWTRAANERRYCQNCIGQAVPSKLCDKCGLPNEAVEPGLRLIRDRFCDDCARCDICLRQIPDGYRQLHDRLFCDDCEMNFEAKKFDLETIGGLNGLATTKEEQDEADEASSGLCCEVCGEGDFRDDHWVRARDGTVYCQACVVEAIVIKDVPSTLRTVQDEEDTFCRIC